MISPAAPLTLRLTLACLMLAVVGTTSGCLHGKRPPVAPPKAATTPPRASSPAPRKTEAARCEPCQQQRQLMLALDSAPLITLPEAPWEYAAPAPGPLPRDPAPRLTLLSATKADPTRAMNRSYSPDTPYFLAPVDNGALPAGVRPTLPTHYRGESLRAIIPAGALTVLLYGGRYLVILGAGEQPERVFDLEALRHPPRARPQWQQFAEQDVTHAIVADDTVYVCNGGGSYAKEVYGKKGFVTAISRRDGTLRWRSQPLVCNATMALVGPWLLTGYGFTAEPDYLYLLRRADGKMMTRSRLRTGPETIIVEDARVLVESYADSYVFDLRP